MSSPTKFSKRPHILIAEDSPSIRGFIRRALKDRLPDARIEEVENGEEALWHLQTEEVDLIFTDVQMPKIDGIEFLKRSARRRGELGAGVIVLSSAITPAMIEEFAPQEKILFLRKPVTKEEILDHAGRVIAVPAGA